jgi:hypothetical protein
VIAVLDAIRGRAGFGWPVSFELEVGLAPAELLRLGFEGGQSFADVAVFVGEVPRAKAMR